MHLFLLCKNAPFNLLLYKNAPFNLIVQYLSMKMQLMPSGGRNVNFWEVSMSYLQAAGKFTFSIDFLIYRNVISWSSKSLLAVLFFCHNMQTSFTDAVSDALLILSKLSK